MEAAQVKPALPWISAAKIAWRELQASPAKVVFVLLSVAIGVAALTGVRGFSNSFQRTLMGEARTIMAADLSARMFRQTTPVEQKELDAIPGVARTRVTEMVSMASSPADPVPLLISLKAVDPASYPFYGAVKVNPGGSLRNVLTDSTAVVAEDLLIRLHTRVGESLKIGNSRLRIAAVVALEPDRMSSSMGLGPRVMVTQSALARSGLLQQGSRAGERYLFKLPAGGKNIAEVRARIESILPDAQVMDFRESNPSLTEGLTRSTALLSLICLVAMVLGAIGVAMAMRAHLQQRLEVLAIMKSIGARSSDILRIYLLQTLLLGLGGGLLGVLFGLGVELAFPPLLRSLVPIHTRFQFPFGSAAGGLAMGVLTTVLFCLMPLLEIRKVKPNLVLRRMVEEPAGRGTVLQRIREAAPQWIVAAIIIAGLAGIAAALSDSMLIGKWFAVALCLLLLFVLGVARGTLRLLRAFLARTRLHLPSSVRHGMANLYRPGNQSAAVLAALGTGVMLIVAVFLMQDSVVRQMKTTVLSTLPNVFLVDIAANEISGVKNLLAHQPGVRGQMESLPVVSGRIISVDGTPVEALKLKNYPRRLLQSVPMSWSSGEPAGSKLIKGKWWTGGEEKSDALAVSDHVAGRLHLHIGSSIVFASNDRIIAERVAAIIRHDGRHVYGRSEFITTPGALAGLPAVWYGAVNVQPDLVPALQGALFAAYPTITVVNIADVLETIQSLVGHITLVIRFLSAFSMFSGVVILASSIAGTRFRRIREVVVLKTLGAKRSHIIEVISVEFVILGLLAGSVGVLFANLLSWVLLHKMEVPFQFEWLPSLIGVVGMAVLATVTGWLAGARILGQKPLQVLREE